MVLNTLLVFLFLNLACGGALYLWHAMRKGDADFRMGGMDRATALKAYAGWDANNLAVLFRETYGRKYQFEPYTQFSERPYHGKYLNTEEAGYRSIGRVQAWPPGRGTFNVFVFGGSTTFGWGVPDGDTIVANLQRRFDAAGKPVAFYNFGRDGYFSAQEMILLNRLLSQGRAPDFAIFIDGLNDFAEWNGEPDYSDELRRMVDERQAGSGLGSATLEFARQTPLGSLFEIFARRAAHDNRLGKFLDHTDEGAVNSVIGRWRAHKKLTEAMARSFGFQTAFVWQPVPVYRYDISRHFLYDAGGNWFDYGARAKAGYPIMARLRSELEKGGNFLWLADAQDGRNENLYVDAFHYTAPFSADLAGQIARFVEPMINPAQTRSRK
jgi:hypothetical protein